MTKKYFYLDRLFLVRNARVPNECPSCLSFKRMEGTAGDWESKASESRLRTLERVCGESGNFVFASLKGQLFRAIIKKNPVNIPRILPFLINTWWNLLTSSFNLLKRLIEEKLCGNMAQKNMTIVLNLYLPTMYRMTFIKGVNMAKYMTWQVKTCRMHERKNEKSVASG